MDRQKSIDILFNPKSIAVIGASATRGKLGNDVMRNLIDSEFDGRIYPVNPRGDQILGQKVFRSVDDIVGDIDVAVIVIPAKYVLKVVEDCGKKGINVGVSPGIVQQLDSIRRKRWVCYLRFSEKRRKPRVEHLPWRLGRWLTFFLMRF